MSTPNPLHYTHRASPPSTISKKVFTIAGILTTVYGLEELPSQIQEVACLWLLHPRLQTQESMAPIASQTLNEWNNRIKEGRAGRSPRGLIAVSFDQRNHGSREVDKLANEAWRQGNPRHAQDMFSTYHGTAIDTTLLLTHLPSYIFPHPTSSPSLTTNLVLGISLGGHSAWHCILHDPRISAAVIVIGCPDYVRLMSQRAAKSKLKTWTSTSPPGKDFLGSTDFPQGLVEAVRRWDPVGLLANGVDLEKGPSEADVAFLKPLWEKHLAGKRIMTLSGGADKLVPYACSEPFLRMMKSALAPSGWFEGNGTVLVNVVSQESGHEMTPDMAKEAVRFVCETLAGEGTGGGAKDSKI